VARKELRNTTKAVIALAPVAVATDTTTVGLTIDTQGFESCLFNMMTGVLTDGDYDFDIYHGDASDMSDEAATTDIVGTMPDFSDDTDDANVNSVAYVGDKRYLRLKVVSTNTTTGALLCANAILGHPFEAATTAAADT